VSEHPAKKSDLVSVNSVVLLNCLAGCGIIDSRSSSSSHSNNTSIAEWLFLYRVHRADLLLLLLPLLLQAVAAELLRL
jgi:hypothetical protein